jgi:WD40 repeat protein
VFGPDGKLLASAGRDGYVRLWNPATGAQIGAALPAASDQGTSVAGIAFSPDGSVLVEAASDSIKTWQMWLNLDPYEALCTDVGPPTKNEWKRYAPGEPQPDICADQNPKALK